MRRLSSVLCEHERMILVRLLLEVGACGTTNLQICSCLSSAE